MKVLVTGAKGYIGIALCYELTLTQEVIGVDNNSRENWVRKCGGEVEEKLYSVPYRLIYGDLADRDFVLEILAIHKPEVIIHLASQPSMPYSQINGERALFTQLNNVSMCVNLLWAIKELGLKCRFILSTTTGIPGQHYGVILEEPVLNMAGSWYHISRGFDSANCNLASRQWGQDVMELRTSIVYGLQTDTLRNSGLATRFDTDFYFGTVLNRFIKQAVGGEPIIIYGEGGQVKPFISLEDCVRSLANAISYPMEQKHEIFNQVTECISIKELAEIIVKVCPTQIKHILNPRMEKEDFEMRFENNKFLKLLGRTPLKMEDEIKRMIDWL